MPSPKIILREPYRERVRKRTIIPIYILNLSSSENISLIVSRVPKDTTKANYNSKPRLEMRLDRLDRNMFALSDDQVADNKKFFSVNGGLNLSVGSEYKIVVKLVVGSDSDLVVSDKILKVEKQYSSFVKSGTKKEAKALYVKHNNKKKPILKLFISENGKLKRVA